MRHILQKKKYLQTFLTIIIAMTFVMQGAAVFVVNVNNEGTKHNMNIDTIDSEKTKTDEEEKVTSEEISLSEDRVDNAYQVLKRPKITPQVKSALEETQNNIKFGPEKTLYVGGIGPENYTSIQDAVDNASEGDTIFVSVSYTHLTLPTN